MIIQSDQHPVCSGEKWTNWLANTLGTKPLREPARCGQIHSQYFDRVEAIDYMVQHDNG